MAPSHISKAILVPVTAAALFLGGCRRSNASASAPQDDIGPTASVEASLRPEGLPEDFFQPGYDTKCSREVIGYRFVVWLDAGHVAVGFNTSPNCRLSPDLPVQGRLRIVVFGTTGAVAASRDLTYLADGNGEVVADGEAMPGPDGTLLIRFQSVNLDREGRQESPSSVRLLDAGLKDVAQVDRFLEQTTLVEHDLVFQDGVVFTGPRNYSILSGPGLKNVDHQQVDWPSGTRDRKFGAHELAFIHCEQELRPGQYSSSNVVSAGAKVRCTLNVLGEKQDFWTRQLADGQGANLVGVLSDGSVVGVTFQNGGENLVLWTKGQDPNQLPWIPFPLTGEISSTAHDFSRYALFATSDVRPCNALTRVLGTQCDEGGDGRWYVFDRKSSQPIVSRALPKSGRAALSPDGLHYATFEAGELRIYSLPK